jgi:hypothetical protein
VRYLTFLVLAAWPALAADTWTQPFPGVQHLHRTGPNNLNVHAAVVDLCAPGVSVRHTDFTERARRTSTQAVAVGAQLAINGDWSCRPIDVGPNSPFPPCIGKPVYGTYGIAAHAGVPWPDPVELDAVLAFAPDRVELFDWSEHQPFEPWMQEVISGHWSYVANGQASTLPHLFPPHCPLEPRTAVGLSKDRRKLMVAVVDGRNGYRGMSCAEMGALMVELGAERAFGLDGGGSSTFWMSGPGVLNHPSDGSERVVGPHLAIYASGSGPSPFCDRPFQLDPAAPLPAFTPAGPHGRLVSRVPTRVFDTRPNGDVSGLQGLSRDGTGRVAAQSSTTWSGLASHGVGADQVAAVLNVTATDMAEPGFVTAWGAGSPQPNVSALNYAPGPPVANLVPVRLGGGAGASLYVRGATHLVGDLLGTFGPQGAGLVLEPPTRKLDTRSGQPLQPFVPHQLVGADAPGVEAHALNVTAVSPAAEGYVTVFPCHEPTPTASNLNFGANSTTAAAVMARTGPGGVCAVSSVETHLVVDSAGRFVSNGGLDYQPAEPTRLVDTRNTSGRWTGRPTTGSPLPLSLQGMPGLPADLKGVVLNLTAVNPTENGYAAIVPCNAGPPAVSNLNFQRNATRANLVVADVGSGELCLTTSGRSHFIVDLLGGFVEPAPPADGGTVVGEDGGTGSNEDGGSVSGEDGGTGGVTAGPDAGPVRAPDVLATGCPGCSTGVGVLPWLALGMTLLGRRRRGTTSARP